MKKNLILIIILLMPITVFADLIFEYEMATSVGKNGVSEMLITHEKNYVSDVGLKILSVESQTATIIRIDKKVIWEVDLANGFYTETPFDQIDKMRGEQTQKSSIKVEATAIEENVCGYNSKKYLVYMDGELMSEVWTTMDKPFDKTFIDVYKNYSSFTMDSYSELNDINGFPVQTTFSAKSGDTIVETKSFLKSVTNKKIDTTEFDLPKGLIKITPKNE